MNRFNIHFAAAHRTLKDSKACFGSDVLYMCLKAIVEKILKKPVVSTLI